MDSKSECGVAAYLACESQDVLTTMSELAASDMDSGSEARCRTHPRSQCSSVEFARDAYDIVFSSRAQAILFGWWPRTEEWNQTVVVQSSVQCLPAVRPGLDLVALPFLPEVEELWVVWCQEHMLSQNQALWFAPRLGAGSGDDPAQEVAEEVLAALAALRESPRPPVLLQRVCLCTSHVTSGIEAAAAAKDVWFRGDVGICEQPVCGLENLACCPTSAAKCLRRLRMLDGEPRKCFDGEDLPDSCVGVARKLHQAFKIPGPWSVDFTRDECGAFLASGVTKGCTGAELAIELWASRSRHPVSVCIAEYAVPKEGAPSAGEVLDTLRSEELLWDGEEGALLFQLVPGGTMALAIASSFSPEAVGILRKRTEALLRSSFGLAEA